MLSNVRLSVLVLITMLVLGGLSVVPSPQSNVIQAAETNYQTLSLRLSESDGKWFINDSPSRGLVVSLPPYTSIEVTLGNRSKNTIQSVQFFPLHDAKNRQFRVFPAATTNGMIIDSSQLSLGRYTCCVHLDGKTEGAPREVLFDVAVTPAVSKPGLVQTHTK